MTYPSWNAVSKDRSDGTNQPSELRDTVVAKSGAAERLACLQAETMEETRLFELRGAEAISQAELLARLGCDDAA